MRNKRLAITALCSCAVICAAVLYCTRCTPLGYPAAQQRQLTLMTYNTQTFFDAVEDGREFAEFKGSKSRWTEKKYRTRLERLKETVCTAGERLTGAKGRLPDILVLQEIESKRVVEDFCKQLSAHENYPYAVCPPLSSNAAFTTVVLSKYPIDNFFVHHLYAGESAALRPLLETVINTGTADKPQLLTVFSVHWKSKSGNYHKSSAIRKLQEAQLIRKITEHTNQSPAVPFIVCGDFNQPLTEFRNMQRFAVCWNLADYEHAAAVQQQPAGSYYFRNSWEKIDHIFYAADSGRIQPTAFFVLYEPPLIEEAYPKRYNVLTGEGYSDHLPLVFSFMMD